MKYSYDSQSLYENGRPVFPVMGEMHFSRYSEKYWEESLRKMKAGGVTVVASYVFWIHHEEEEGVFDFSGSRNLRAFVECCRRVGLDMFLRIGPWSHGEARNGGFPDWLVDKAEKGMKLRTNDECYMNYVKRFWQRIYGEVRGLMEADGGPIIGIQIENEYWVHDKDPNVAGDSHMRRLESLAKELGFNASLYTATGWGNVSIGDAIPVTGGYCDAPWAQHTEELPPNKNYVISHTRIDELIGSDLIKAQRINYDGSAFPYLTAELGGGVQVTAHRRPVATGKDIGAMTTTKLASGVALLGYYMYHGGSNPKGKLTTLEERRDTKYTNHNDLPEINYDFNAPIRQYGTISDSYKEVKLLALFLKDFGAELVRMPAVIEPDNVKPEDMHTLRRSCRYLGDSGYVFFNNYVRRHTMDAHPDVILKGKTESGQVEFPPINIENGDYGFFPYNMKLGDALLESALATPLCRLDGEGGETFVFYGDIDPHYKWKNGKAGNILHISKEMALNAYKVHLDRDYLIINDDFVWEKDGALTVIGGENTIIRTYPALKTVPAGFEKLCEEWEFTLYLRKTEPSGAAVSFAEAEAKEDYKQYSVSISYGENMSTDRDLILWLDYVGFRMDVYAGDEKINDHFYTGQSVPLRLGYFGFPKTLTVKIKALRQDDWVYLEKWPQLTDGKACGLCGALLRDEQR